MKRVLITGANSYVGDSVSSWLKQKGLSVEILDMLDESWRKKDFSSFDVVFHVAGLAHRKITKDIEPLYYSINCDLACEVAEKSKKEGVSQFIFMSSMSVYSDSESIIDKSTPTCPDNAYGKSKLMAEQRLNRFQDESFKIVVLRPPMIYGKNCKGNYTSLRRIALRFPVFPKVKNRRSMIYIDNLSEFVFQVIINGLSGVYMPQNSELVNTSNWAFLIAKENGHKLYLSSILGIAVFIAKHLPIVGLKARKAFGDSYYSVDSGITDVPFKYQIVDFDTSIQYTEEVLQK